jgi:hypothetical protein
MNQHLVSPDHLSIVDLLSARLRSDAERGFPVSDLDVNTFPKLSCLLLAG